MQKGIGLAAISCYVLLPPLPFCFRFRFSLFNARGHGGACRPRDADGDADDTCLVWTRLGHGMESQRRFPAPNPAASSSNLHPRAGLESS